MSTFYREIHRNRDDSSITVHDFYLSTNEKQMIGTYIDEIRPSNQNGRFQYFYSDGTIKSIYDYNCGILHGELRHYYINGILKSIDRFYKGIKVDTSWSYYNNGQLKKIRVKNAAFSEDNASDKFKRTELVASYDRTGKTLVENGNGVYKDYYHGGKPKTEIQYANGFPHGKWIMYSEQKKRVSCIMTFKEGRFIKGEMHGRGKHDIFSSLRREAYFPSGKKDLEKFMSSNIGGCEEAFGNDVLILIVISERGKVSLQRIISGNLNTCQLEEIQKMISTMPLWAPAIDEGLYVEGVRSIKISYAK